MNYTDVLKPQKIITNGGRCTLHKGEAVRYANLPDYPVAVVVYNSTRTNLRFRIAYNKERPKAYVAENLETSGYSLGHAYLINPGVTKTYDITIAVSGFNPDGASLEVYIAGAGLPMEAGIREHDLSLEGEPFIFDGYSRVYCTPMFSWYNLKVETAEEGLTGFVFQDDRVMVNSLNVASEQKKNIKDLITIGAGIDPKNVSYGTVEGTKWEKELYGSVLQVAYDPVTTSDDTGLGRISITPTD